MRVNSNGNLVLEDAYIFGNMLADKYGIQMYPVQKPNVYNFVGEFYTMRGTPMRISIMVYPNRTDVKVVTATMQCVYQKSYSTAADTKALSKSVGLFNFIEKAYKTM
mgnify:CR=1 FL=1